MFAKVQKPGIKHLSFVHPLVQIPVRIPMDLQWLKGAKPGRSLTETGHHFVDQLSPEQYQTLREVCISLDKNGKELRVGTTCSGLETGGVVVQKTFDGLNERFNTRVTVRTVFAAELNKDILDKPWRSCSFSVTHVQWS